MPETAPTQSSPARGRWQAQPDGGGGNDNVCSMSSPSDASGATSPLRGRIRGRRLESRALGTQTHRGPHPRQCTHLRHRTAFVGVTRVPRQRCQKRPTPSSPARGRRQAQPDGGGGNDNACSVPSPSDASGATSPLRGRIRERPPIVLKAGRQKFRPIAIFTPAAHAPSSLNRVHRPDARYAPAMPETAPKPSSPARGRWQAQPDGGGGNDNAGCPTLPLRRLRRHLPLAGEDQGTSS